jgi:hypothetical protein
MTSGFQMDRCQKNEYDVISKHQIPSKSSDVCGTTIVAENRSLAVHDSTHVKKSKIEKIMEYQVPGTGKTARTHWKKNKNSTCFASSHVSLFHRQLRWVLALLVRVVIYQTTLSQVT